jgi:hypothetical protein
LLCIPISGLYHLLGKLNSSELPVDIYLHE